MNEDLSEVINKFKNILNYFILTNTYFIDIILALKD